MLLTTFLNCGIDSQLQGRRSRSTDGIALLTCHTHPLDFKILQAMQTHKRKAARRCQAEHAASQLCTRTRCAGGGTSFDDGRCTCTPSQSPSKPLQGSFHSLSALLRCRIAGHCKPAQGKQSIRLSQAITSWRSRRAAPLPLQSEQRQDRASCGPESRANMQQYSSVTAGNTVMCIVVATHQCMTTAYPPSLGQPLTAFAAHGLNRASQVYTITLNVMQ